MTVKLDTFNRCLDGYAKVMLRSALRASVLMENYAIVFYERQGRPLRGSNRDVAAWFNRVDRYLRYDAERRGGVA